MLGGTREPFTPTVEGDRLYGHGGQNMKGGVATMITAAEAIRLAGVRLRGDLVLACVVGETQGGEGTHHLVQSGLRTDMAVLPEPYGLGHLVTIHGGIVHLAVHTYGVTGHISQQEKTVNAVLMMAKIVAALPGVRFTHVPRPELPALPRLNVGSVVGGRGRDYNLRGAYTVSDFCSCYINIRFNASQSEASLLADLRRTLDALRATVPEFEYEIEFPPAPSRGLGRLCKAAVDVPVTEPVVQTVVRNLRLMSGSEPEHLGVRLPQSYAGNDTTHLWQAGIPCCLYGPGGGYTDYHDVHVNLDELFLVTRVLALTALEATA
jgi:acetylornithine deacetylase